MKKKLHLLLGIISISGTLCSCQGNIEWKEDTSASDLQFAQLRKSWDEGIPLGNATGTSAQRIVSLALTTVFHGFAARCKRETICLFKRNTTGLTTNFPLLRNYREPPLSFLWKNLASRATSIYTWTMLYARHAGITAQRWKHLFMPMSLSAGLCSKTSLTPYAPVWLRRNTTSQKIQGTMALWQV